jgi:hypothetical protein
MELTIRAATPAERLYAYEQSTQISNQCGNLGYLAGRLDENGGEFLDHLEWAADSRNAPEFKAEFDQVLAALRFDESCGQVLQSRSAMVSYCLDHPEGRLTNGREYAFQVATKDYSYLLRCVPNGEENEIYLYPYRRDWLDRHMKQAEKGIRFITPVYKELFRIPDGDMVRINRPDGTHIDRVCRYIDDYHLEVGNGWDSLFHIFQFAEQMERCNNTVIPLRSSLPDQCYSVLPSNGEIIIIKKGETGYYSTGKSGYDRTEAQRIVDENNQIHGVGKAQEAAMLSGSMFGWAAPAADPKNYDAQGNAIPQRHHSRDWRDER